MNSSSFAPQSDPILQTAQFILLLLCYKSLSVGSPLTLDVMRARSILAVSAFVTLAVTDPLDKPLLADSLDYLPKSLLQFLQPTNGWYTQWGPDWIPADCKSMAEDTNLSATDVDVFNVQYNDVGIRSAFSKTSTLTCPSQCPNDLWILCRHKDSPDPILNMIDLFGRVPIQSRQWVRHIINLPDRKLPPVPTFSLEFRITSDLPF